MKFIYPAILHPLAEGRFAAEVPDLTGCRAEGFSIDDCMEEINAAALEWITLELEEGESLPPVSDPEDLKDRMRSTDLLRNVCITYRAYDGWDE